jgi:type I restriction enzyme S subunit
MSNATTHIKTKKQLVPAFRFKEFDGDYRIVNVNDCIEFLTDYHANGSYERLKENVELLEKEDYAIMIRTTNFEKKDFQNNLLYISEHAYNYLKKSKVLGDDIIINKIANAGATYIMPHLNRPVSLAMNLFMLRTNSNNSGKYIYYKIKTKEFRLRALSSGTGTKTITKQDVKTFKLEIPDLPEQQKIASFLSAVDEKIQQLSKKETLLKEYKKGVMQQLFSGQLRFKDENGNPYPDWEEKRLGEVFGVIRGKGISKDQLNDNGVTKCILYGQLYTTYSEVVFNVVSRTDTNEGVLSMKGDLLVPSSTTTTGIDLANVTALNEEGVLLGGDISILRSKLDTNNVFYAYYLSNHKKYEIAAFAQGSTIVHLSYNHFKVMRIDIPVIEEQQKIATYLSSIDTKIEAVNNQITQTQSFKKGLLQQMFV